jgi:hypothetical protein
LIPEFPIDAGGFVLAPASEVLPALSSTYLNEQAALCRQGSLACDAKCVLAAS